MTIPTIDPHIRHISIGQLRKEKDFADTLVVSEGSLPVAVVVPYAVFLEMQQAITAGGGTEIGRPSRG